MGNCAIQVYEGNHFQQGEYVGGDRRLEFRHAKSQSNGEGQQSDPAEERIEEKERERGKLPRAEKQTQHLPFLFHEKIVPGLPPGAEREADNR